MNEQQFCRALTLSHPLVRPKGLPVYVARVPRRHSVNPESIRD
jgi:hypothetical protein